MGLNVLLSVFEEVLVKLDIDTHAENWLVNGGPCGSLDGELFGSLAFDWCCVNSNSI